MKWCKVGLCGTGSQLWGKVQCHTQLLFLVNLARFVCLVSQNNASNIKAKSLIFYVFFVAIAFDNPFQPKGSPIDE